MLVLKRINNGPNSSDNHQSIINLDTAHDNLSNVVLTEVVSVVNGLSINNTVDYVTQSGTLGAKWFVVAHDDSGNRYACNIYSLHDGEFVAAFTEYAILTIGDGIDLDFDVEADGTNMALMVDNNSTFSTTIKTQRITISTDPVDTIAVIT